MENLPINTENRLRELLGCWEMASEELKKNESWSRIKGQMISFETCVFVWLRTGNAVQERNESWEMVKTNIASFEQAMELAIEAIFHQYLEKFPEILEIFEENIQTSEQKKALRMSWQYKWARCFPKKEELARRIFLITSASHS
jgi:hypothetical protein